MIVYYCHAADLSPDQPSDMYTAVVIYSDYDKLEARCKELESEQKEQLEATDLAASMLIKNRDRHIEKLESENRVLEAKLKKIKEALQEILKYDQNCDCGADTGNGSQVDLCYFHELMEITAENLETT